MAMADGPRVRSLLEAFLNDVASTTVDEVLAARAALQQQDAAQAVPATEQVYSSLPAPSSSLRLSRLETRTSK